MNDAGFGKRRSRLTSPAIGYYCSPVALVSRPRCRAFGKRSWLRYRTGASLGISIFSFFRWRLNRMRRTALILREQWSDPSRVPRSHCMLLNANKTARKRERESSTDGALTGADPSRDQSQRHSDVALITTTYTSQTLLSNPRQIHHQKLASWRFQAFACSLNHSEERQRHTHV